MRLCVIELEEGGVVTPVCHFSGPDLLTIAALIFIAGAVAGAIFTGAVVIPL